MARGDLGDADSLDAAFDGIDVISIRALDGLREGPRRRGKARQNVVAEQSRNAGVRDRVIDISGLHPGHRTVHASQFRADHGGEILIAPGIETIVRRRPSGSRLGFMSPR